MSQRFKKHSPCLSNKLSQRFNKDILILLLLSLKKTDENNRALEGNQGMQWWPLVFFLGVAFLVSCVAKFRFFFLFFFFFFLSLSLSPSCPFR